MKKHLSATKRALGELRYTYNERDISSYETHEFKDILLSDKANIIEYVQNHAYLKFHIELLIEKLESPHQLKSFIESHEERLKLQLQRVYRARCDIVHSAELLVSPALLCANLEFYLKHTLRRVLDTIVIDTHIKSTQEFFKNASFQYQLLLKDLGCNKTDEFTHCLKRNVMSF